jgi:hypothetical protein
MKNWGLPTRKGTEAFPRVTVPPPKLVIEGIDAGTPLYRAVVERFSGRLEQFVGKCRQDYSLTAIENIKRRFHWPDGKAVYTNIAGQETINLQVVNPQPGEEPNPKIERVPDYAVVDFVIKDFARPAHMTAAMMTPRVIRTDYMAELQGVPGRPADGEIIGVKGIEIDPHSATRSFDHRDYSYFAERPIIKIAHISEAVNSAEDQIVVDGRIMSLLVDFRDLPKEAMVIVDIFGWMTYDTEFVESEVLVGYHAGVPTYVPGELFNPDYNPDCIIETVEFAKYTQGLGGGGGSEPPFLWVVGGPGGAEFDNDEWNEYRTTINNMSGSFIDYYTSDTYWELQEVYWWTFATEEITGSGSVEGMYSARGYVSKQTGHRHYLRNEVHTPKEPVYEPQIVEVPINVDVPCDVIYKFYDPGARFYSIDAGGFRAFWNTEPDSLPERTYYSTFTMHSSWVGGEPTDDSPWGFQKLGRLTLDRKTRSISWRPVTEQDE